MNTQIETEQQRYLRLLCRSTHLPSITAAMCSELCTLTDDEQPSLLLAVTVLYLKLQHGDVCVRLERESFAEEVERCKEAAQRGNALPYERELAELMGKLLNQDDYFLRVDAQLKALQERNPTLPLLTDKGRLYLKRYYDYECQAADFVAHRQRQLPEAAPERLGALLDLLCGSSTDESGQIERQKCAVALASQSGFFVISGGPGTGKTTTVTKLLLLLQALSPKMLKIMLAAPTGKAAARVSESLTGGLGFLRKSLAAVPPKQLEAAFGSVERLNELLDNLPQSAQTVHSLLKVIPHRSTPYFNRVHQLSCEVLVIDEVSMVDLPLFAKICAALPEQARLILLGDKDQLCSVEAGSVLADICKVLTDPHKNLLDQRGRERLAQALGLKLEQVDSLTQISAGAAVLTKTHRFTESIAALSALVNNPKLERAERQSGIERCLSAHAQDKDTPLALHYYEDARQAQKEICELALGEHGYAPYLKLLLDGTVRTFEAEDPEPLNEVFTALDKFRLLCSNREGVLGIEQLNARLEKLIRQRYYRGALEWFPGRVILVTRNNPTLKVANGDVGFCAPDTQGQPKVWFKKEAEILALNPVYLTDYELGFALTVHKSQGSEYQHVALCLPPRDNPVLTRELIYTGITRAKRQLTLFSPQEVLLDALDKSIRRESGLSERLLDTGSAPAGES
ncbi:MAG: exodeoxyribonuclease V subunit alpha, partial [Succinivibrio sp.]|nr:exodeoxyribonuclease V subunit alpha [Succinivibrio sp.]